MQAEMPAVPLSKKYSPLRVALIFAYLPALLLISVTGITGYAMEIPIGNLTRDVAAAAGVPAYTGALSTAGILLWCATASICLLTSIVLHTHEIHTEAKYFIFGSGILTLILMTDDAFMIHENAPRLFGVSNNVVFGIYGMFAAVLFAKSIGFILQSDYNLLIPSLAFLAGSIVFDKLHDYQLLQAFVTSRGFRFLLEDGLKLLGIAGWFSYFGWVCYVLLGRKSRLSAWEN